MDTSETGLEKIIVDWLRDQNGYKQETLHAYNRDSREIKLKNTIN